MPTKTLAPRLISGECRRVVFLNLPPEIWKGLKQAARIDRTTVSWIIEQAIIESAQGRAALRRFVAQLNVLLARPEYKPRKRKLRRVA